MTNKLIPSLTNNIAMAILIKNDASLFVKILEPLDAILMAYVTPKILTRSSSDGCLL